MNAAGRRKIGYTTLALSLLVFVAAVMASNALLTGWRIDLTENRLYTLSPGARSMLEGLEEPINLYLFFSDEATADVPFLRSYAVRVRELLEELASHAGGRLTVSVVDPQPFSEEEDRATQLGLTPINLGSAGDNVFFGLAGTNSVGDEAVIPFLQPDKEMFLEYDVARLIYSLAHPEKTTIGLIDGISMAGGFDPATQQLTQPWTALQQARQLFDVRVLPASLERIDDDIDVLWVVHPAQLDDAALYAIDQFVMRGGRALIFVDPIAEIAAAREPPGSLAPSHGSTLDTLFTAWGVDFSADDVVVDDVNALAVTVGAGRPVRHIGLLGIGPDGLNAEDVITADLETINLGTAGHFTQRDAADADLALRPLMTSSDRAATMPAARLQFVNDPGELLNDFRPTGERYVLAARLEGRLETAFPDGPPGLAAAGNDDTGTADEDAAQNAEAPGDQASTNAEPSEDDTSGAHLASVAQANVVLVGDVDILSDRMWVQRQSFLGQPLVTAFASNGDFLVNTLDNLSGSADLIGLRSRATFSRPFTTVEALQREADAEFRATEQRLQQELADTEARLAQLQSQREDSTSLLMSPEQQQEVQRFLDEQVRIRQELRAVRRNLDRSIEQLGTTLKVLNIVVLPIALTALLLVVALVERRRKRPR